MNQYKKTIRIFLTIILTLSIVTLLIYAGRSLINENTASKSIKSDTSLMEDSEKVNLSTDDETVQTGEEAELVEVDDEAVQTGEEAELAEADEIIGVNIMYPPSSLLACVGDGITDVTTELQAIIDYCVANNQALIIPSGQIFRVSQVKIANTDGFTLYGYGTLKRIDNAPYGTTMLQIMNSDNVNIPILHTDGNVDNNLGSDGARVQEDSHSIRFRTCNNVTIGAIYDINPVGDGVYLHTVNDLTAELISSIADNNSGRNGLTIIAGDTMEIDKVVSTNIGVPSMPGGLDLEPNDGDEIHNVTVHHAIIDTVATGFQVSANYDTNVIDNISVNAQITRTHSDENNANYASILNGVTNSDFDLSIVQNIRSDGPELIDCDYIDLKLNVSNCDAGLLITNTHNFNISGSISDTTKGSVHFYGIGVPSSNGVIDMTLKNSDRNNEGTYGAIYNGFGTILTKITFSGDFSKDKSAANCINNEGVMIKCTLEDLDTSGFSSADVITGGGITDLTD